MDCDAIRVSEGFYIIQFYQPKALYTVVQDVPGFVNKC